MPLSIEINGLACTDLRVHYPGHGVGVFVAKMPEAKKMPAAPLGLVLKYDGLTVVGTLVSTYEYHAGIELRACFGAYGWGKTTQPIAMSDHSGVKLSTMLAALERATGESFESKPDTKLGTHFTHQAGPAIWALNQLAPNWYVSPTGKTVLGSWTASKVKKDFELVSASEPNRTCVARSGSLKEWLPGATFGTGVYTEAIVDSVTHIISPDSYEAAVTMRRANV